MRFKLLIFLLLPFIARAGTNDGTLLLHNDTVMILTAVISGADGTFLGQFTVQPGQQRNWTSNLYPSGYVHPGTPDISMTPYTVIWQCPSGEPYSVCTGISPGSYVTPGMGAGNKYCKPKPEQQKKEAPPASSLKKTK